MEITRKKVAEVAAPAITGFVSGWRTGAGPMLSGVLTILCWKSGCKKTALFYGALTAAQLQRIYTGYEEDEAGDEKFCEQIEKKIAGE